MSDEHTTGHESVWSTLKLTTAFSVAVAFSAVGAGCSFAPINEEAKKVNTEHFETGQDLRQSMEDVQIGMHYEEIINTLALEEDAFKPMDTTGVMKTLYGDQAQLRGNLDELEQARVFFDQLSGYKFDYVNKESERYYSGVTQHLETEGSRFEAAFIFDSQNKLIKMDMPGTDLDAETSRTILPRLNGVDVDDLGL